MFKIKKYCIDQLIIVVPYLFILTKVLYEEYTHPNFWWVLLVVLGVGIIYYIAANLIFLALKDTTE